MTIPRFLDTNILLYSISRDPNEATKHDRGSNRMHPGESVRPILLNGAATVTRWRQKA